MCRICKQGEILPGIVTVTLQRGESTIIFKGIPADVCQNCGEYYLSESASADLLERARGSTRKGVDVERLRYAA